MKLTPGEQAVLNYLTKYPVRGKGLPEIGWGVGQVLGYANMVEIQDCLKALERFGRVKFIKEKDPAKRMLANEGWSLK